MAAYDIIAPIVAPIGLSFATFRALDLLIKIRLELLKPISPLSLAYYGFFGPVLAVGPVIEYEEVRLKDRLTRFPAASDIGAGLFRIALGAIKVMALAYFLSKWSNDLWRSGEAGWAASWAAVLLYGMFFYVNFSGYSDLAIERLAPSWRPPEGELQQPLYEDEPATVLGVMAHEPDSLVPALCVRPPRRDARFPPVHRDLLYDHDHRALACAVLEHGHLRPLSCRLPDRPSLHRQPERRCETGERGCSLAAHAEIVRRLRLCLVFHSSVRPSG
ncbi:MAG: hypothetical protein R3C55_08715 [Parvularculaceae bacterium]